MKKNVDSEKYLIVEQRGWRVVFLGLALASLVSLTFRALFSPRRIQYEIERALSAGDSRVKSVVEGAYLSLSDGVWPRLAIVITKLHFQSKDPCLFEANASIENLVLPVDFSTLLDRTLVFKRIEVGLLKMEMRARRIGCGTIGLNPVLPSEPLVADPLSSKSVAAPHDPKALERPPLVQTMSVESSFLKHIVFHEVQLQLLEWPMFHWNLKEVDVQLPKAGDPKTRIHGLMTMTSGPSAQALQGIHARMILESDSQAASVKIEGAWREGRIELSGDWAPDRKDFKWIGSFRQIPWSQLMSLAQILGEKSALPSSSQAWVSAQVEWHHESEGPERVIVKEAQIEGEFGDFNLGKVMAQRPHNSTLWAVEPYKVLAHDVDLDILMKMLGWQEPPSTFDQIGNFEGEAHFEQNHLVALSGTWKDLLVVFSNRGRRELQSVQKVKVELTGDSKNQWEGSLREIELDEGQWKGDFSIRLNQNSKTVELNSMFTDVQLNPQVVRLMTLNGQLGILEGRLHLKLVQGVVDELGGYLRLDRGTVNEVVVEKAKIDFEGAQKIVNGRIQIQTVHWPRVQLTYWPHPLPTYYENLYLKTISGFFRGNVNHFEITSLQGLLPDLRARFQLDAGWSDEQQLFGNLLIRSERKTQNYFLTGSRTSPAWREVVK